MTKAGIRSSTLFGTTLFFWIAQYAYTPYVNPELAQMGASAIFMGFVSGGYGFSQLVLRFPLGIIADQWQKKIFIMAGCLIGSLATFCMLFFYSPAAFLLGRLLCGIAAATWAPFIVLFSSYYEPEQAAKSISTINLANQIGRMLSFVVAGLIVTHFGPKSAFCVSVTGGLAAFIGSLFVYEAAGVQGKKPLQVSDLLAITSDYNLRVTSALSVLVQIVAFGTYFTFISNYAVSIGATAAQLSYLSILPLLSSSIAIFLVIKYILQRIDAKWLVAIGFFVTAFYCGALPAAETVLQVYMMQIFAGVGNALTLLVLMGLCVRDISVEKRGTAMGFFQAAYAVGMTIGPIVMGFLTYHLSLQAAFFFMAGVAALSGFVSIFSIRKRNPALKEPG